MSRVVPGEFRNDAPFQQDALLGADARRVVSDISQFFSRARVEKAAALAGHTKESHCTK